MFSDYRILGIDEGSDLASVKRAFRKRAKELHPDLASEEDALSRHDLFSQVCAAYRRLVATIDPNSSSLADTSLAGTSRGAGEVAPVADSQSADWVGAGRRGAGGQGAGRHRADGRQGASGHGASGHGAGGQGASGDGTGGQDVAPHSHQDYVFYRQGMRFFVAIHPSQWNFDRMGGLDSSRWGDEEESAAAKARVVALMKFFPKAYYYFSLVVHEYPESEWVFDACNKMAVIETRIGMYRKILASFDRNLGREAAREHGERYAKMSEGLRSVRRDMPEEW
ncbi:MAG: J domain-containing protein [Treponema sp.]|nr:J domain-containing protein [Treponema sp.]